MRAKRIEVTAAEASLLALIDEWTAERKCPPAIVELAREERVEMNVVLARLVRLRAKRVIVWNPQQYRSVRRVVPAAGLKVERLAGGQQVSDSRRGIVLYGEVS